MEKGKMGNKAFRSGKHTQGAKLANHYSIDNLELKRSKNVQFL